MKRLAVLALVIAPALASAKPVFYRPRDTVDSETLATAAMAKLGAAIRAKSVSGIREVLGAQFTNNGMWFPDAACAKRFEVSGPVKGAEVIAFARCLAGLSLQVSTRKAAPRDGGLLTVDPGVEIELAFDGEHVRWIGLPTQGGADRALPMLTAQALEGLRTQGSTILDDKVGRALEIERTNQGATMATSWIKVCLDAKGEITKLTSVQASTPGAASAFVEAAADWKFKPFQVRGQGVPACALSLLVYPASKAPSVEQYPSTLAPVGQITRSYDFDDDFEIVFSGTGTSLVPPPPPPPPPAANVPQSILEGLRVSGTKSIVPDPPTRATMVQAKKARVVAVMKVCIDDKGSVSSVTQLKSSGFPAYDRKILAEMQKWIYNPYKQNGRAVPVCSTVTLAYDVGRP